MTRETSATGPINFTGSHSQPIKSTAGRPVFRSKVWFCFSEITCNPEASSALRIFLSGR